MSTETLVPTGELSDAGLVANTELDHDEDPDVSSVTINATGNNTDTEWGADFNTPTGPPTVGAGLQEFRVGVEEFDGGQSGTPDVRIELWENGSLVRAGSDTPVSSYAVLSLTWNANELSTPDGSLVQCKVIGSSTGGAPTKRNTVRIGHIEWNVDYTIVNDVTIAFDPATVTVSTESFEINRVVELGPSTISPTGGDFEINKVIEFDNAALTPTGGDFEWPRAAAFGPADETPVGNAFSLLAPRFVQFGPAVLSPAGEGFEVNKVVEFGLSTVTVTGGNFELNNKFEIDPAVLTPIGNSFTIVAPETAPMRCVQGGMLGTVGKLMTR